MPTALHSERPEWVSLRRFMEQQLRPFAERFCAQRIRWCLDIPVSLHTWVPRTCLSQILTWCLQDSLQAMGAEGQLDITAVESETGLEIEIADTRDTFPSRASVHFLQPTGVRLDAVRCPQGGWARTIFLSKPEVARFARPDYDTERRRRAA